jgi:methylamine dehydrogenase accessory protein MauD
VSGLWLISYIALWILVALLTIVVLGLVRQFGLIYLRLGPEQHLATTREGLDLGKSAPVFRGLNLLNENEIALDDLLGHQSVLVFVSPSCIPCIELMPHLNTFQNSNNGKVKILLVCQSESRASLELTKKYNLKMPVVSDSEGEISKAYQVFVTPFAYRLDEEGLVRRRGIVNDFEGLEALLEEAVSSEPMVELPKEAVTNLASSQ